jgi:DNA (cytosine-5)-methyltransferase 1
VTALVLSLFPGIGLLDMAFEAEGFCVVRGPDALWGGDIHAFHPPAGRFDGVIGGPPCQCFSRLANIVRAVHGEDSVAANLIPEYARVVDEARPEWFLMENVPEAPRPVVPGYEVQAFVLNNRECGGEQNRARRFSFGARVAVGAFVPPFPFEPVAANWEPAVCSTAGGRRASVAIGGNGKPKGNQARGADARLRVRSIEDQARLQGLPADFLADAPFTRRGKEIAIGNGVPIPMGRAVARAVKRALATSTLEAAS